jgi:heme/copper-type cytochrome/quinol oxidase subunit 2
MESQPDVQLGKIFIVLWIGFMLFIIISIVVVYFNAKNETSSCDAASITNVEKSKESSSMGRTPKLFIAFLAITLFAVSTMNLTYKINSFEKKVEKPAPSTSNLLGMIENLQKNKMVEPIVPSAASQFLANPSAPPENK